MKNWTPFEIRKLIALIAGILMAGSGIVMLFQQISTTGKININLLSIIEGEIESGSTGLLLIFISFFIIIWSTSGSSLQKITKLEAIKSKIILSTKNKIWMGSLIFLWILAIVICIVWFITKETNLLFFVGLVSSVAVMLTFTFLINLSDNDDIN